MRSDMSLVTGMNSESAVKVAEKRKVEEKQVEKQAAVLDKHSSELYSVIEEYREQFMSIQSLLVLESDTDVSILQELKARKQHLDFLDTFETRVRQILGAKP